MGRRHISICNFFIDKQSYSNAIELRTQTQKNDVIRVFVQVSPEITLKRLQDRTSNKSRVEAQENDLMKTQLLNKFNSVCNDCFEHFKNSIILKSEGRSVDETVNDLIAVLKPLL